MHSKETKHLKLSKFIEHDKPTFLGDYNDDMQRLDDAFSLLQSRINKLSGTTAECEAEEKSIREELASLQAQVSVLRERVNTIVATTVQPKDIENLQRQINTLNESLNAKIETLTTNLATYESTTNNRIQDLESEVTSLATSIVALTRDAIMQSDIGRSVQAFNQRTRIVYNPNSATIPAKSGANNGVATISIFNIYTTGDPFIVKEGTDNDNSFRFTETGIYQVNMTSKGGHGELAYLLEHKDREFNSISGFDLGLYVPLIANQMTPSTYPEGTGAYAATHLLTVGTAALPRQYIMKGVNKSAWNMIPDIEVNIIRLGNV